MPNHEIRRKISDIIYHIARYMEILISIGILIIALLSAVHLFLSIKETSLMSLDTEFFTAFLAQALAIIVGLEFVNMLCHHTVDGIIEVLLFATARQMVVEHLKNWETLIGVIAIGVLFAIHKYLLIKPSKKDRGEEPPLE